MVSPLTYFSQLNQPIKDLFSRSAILAYPHLMAVSSDVACCNIVTSKPVPSNSDRTIRIYHDLWGNIQVTHHNWNMNRIPTKRASQLLDASKEKPSGPTNFCKRWDLSDTDRSWHVGIQNLLNLRGLIHKNYHSSLSISKGSVIPSSPHSYLRPR